MTKKTIFTRTLLSMALGASLAFMAANAGEKDLILGETIHDYSDDASRNLPVSQSRQDRSGYNVRIVLDKAYYDYSDADMAAFESMSSDLERAEFAVFEEYSSGMPSMYSSSIPWVSTTD